MADGIAPTKTFHRSAYPSIDVTRPELSAKGRSVVITGGGTGIGATTALYFAKAGAERIFLLGRRAQMLQDTKAKIEAEHPTTLVVAVPTDMTKVEYVTSAFTKIASHGKVDVLVSNAAALGSLGNIVDTANYKWLEGVETNIRGTFNIAKAFLADCTEDAVLIDVNSAAAHILLAPGFSAYNVSKIATSRIYSSLVLEHPQLSFFSIQPGTINSNINRTSGYKPQQEGEEFQWGESAKALSQYDDVGLPASFMVWLASGEARFLNGKFLWANWDVDELKEREKELKGSTLLTMGLLGYATT